MASRCWDSADVVFVDGVVPDLSFIGMLLHRTGIELFGFLWPDELADWTTRREIAREQIDEPSITHASRTPSHRFLWRAVPDWASVDLECVELGDHHRDSAASFLACGGGWTGSR